MAQPAQTSENMLDVALTYLSDEWSIFPVCVPIIGQAGRCVEHGQCKHPGKTPLIKWGIYQDRLPTRLEIERWWRHRFQGANIGLATGGTSDVVVVDLDGELAAAEAGRRGYEQGPWVRTGRVGGRHLYFRYRDDAPTIFAKTGGIDFRGQGGFVLLPPSLHHTGARYVWGDPYRRGEPLPSLPRWVDELAATSESGAERGPIDFTRLATDGVAEGARDQELFRAAAKLRGADVPYDLAVWLIERVADACHPPFDRGEARAKVDSAYSRYRPNSPEPRRLFAPPSEGADAETAWPEPENRGLAQLSEQGNVEYVEDLIKPGRIVVWAAEEGSGKSYTVDGELAVRLIAGSGSLAGTWPIVGQHRVLVLSEMHSDDDYEREETVLKSLGLERGVLDGKYWRIPLMTAAHGQPCFRVPEWCSWCTDWCKSKGVHLLIADTATGATDVDPWGREIQAVYRQLRSMLDAYPELAIVLIVHCKKPSDSKSERRITDVIGEWGRWCDVIVLQERDGMTRAKLTTFKRVRHMRKIIATQANGLLIEPVALEAGSTKVPLEQVVRVITEHPGITYQVLADLLNVSKRTASKYGEEAEKMGAIYHIVGEKGTRRAFATAQSGNTAQ